MGRYWLLHFLFFFILLYSGSLSFLKVIPARRYLCCSLTSCFWQNSLSVRLLLIGWLFTTSADQELPFSFKDDIQRLMCLLFLYFFLLNLAILLFPILLVGYLPKLKYCYFYPVLNTTSCQKLSNLLLAVQNNVQMTFKTAKDTHVVDNQKQIMTCTFKKH